MDELKLVTTKYQRVVNCLCLIMLLSSLAYLVFNWSTIPDQIPGHYNGNGVIDRWGNKSELLIVYGVGVLMYIGLSVVEHFPKTWNTGVTITLQNRDRIYGLIKSMLVTMKLIIVVAFMFLTLYSLLLVDLPSWYMIVFLGALFGSMLIYGIRIYQAR